MTLSTANSEGTPDTETEVEAAPAQSRPVPTHDRRRAPRLGRDAVPGIGFPKPIGTGFGEILEALPTFHQSVFNFGPYGDVILKNDTAAVR